MDFLLTFDRLSSDSELLTQFMIQKQLKEKRRDVANMGQLGTIFVANAGQLGTIFVANAGQLGVIFVANAGQLGAIFVANVGQLGAIFVANVGQDGCLNANLPYWAYWANQDYWAYWPILESACSLVIFA